MSENGVYKAGEREHIPLLTLFEHSVNHEALSTDQFRHVTHCNDCLALFGLCLRCDSIEQVEQRLSEAA
jgi:hypothetical protein